MPGGHTRFYEADALTGGRYSGAERTRTVRRAGAEARAFHFQPPHTHRDGGDRGYERDQEAHQRMYEDTPPSSAVNGSGTIT